MNKEFRILSIDGGGIRGIFPAMFLTQLEEELKASGKENWQIYQNFDLICGTSTGGIIALALALGIPAKEIHELYLENSKDIFGNKRKGLAQLFFSAHKRSSLESIIRNKFLSKDGKDFRLRDCKTNVCIPIYDLVEGKPSVYKNNYNPRFTRDFHLPAYQVALATAAAPVFFDPFSSDYVDLNGVSKTFSNKVDGGVFANNPTLLGIIEAKESFGKNLEDLKVLSLGTGTQEFSDGKARNGWGILYWINPFKKRIMDLFLQGQSQLVENLISLMQNGIDKERVDNPTFVYHRISTVLDNSLKIEMDETNKEKLNRLSEKALYQYHDHATLIKQTFID